MEETIFELEHPKFSFRTHIGCSNEGDIGEPKLSNKAFRTYISHIASDNSRIRPTVSLVFLESSDKWRIIQGRASIGCSPACGLIRPLLGDTGQMADETNIAAFSLTMVPLIMSPIQVGLGLEERVHWGRILSSCLA